MKIKLLLIVLAFVFAGQAQAQITVDVFIDGIKSGQYIVPNNAVDSAGIAYKKKDYKKIDRLSIQLSGKGFKKGYLRKVHVNDEKSKEIFSIPETLGADGQFILTDKTVLKKLVSGKPIKLYLDQTPANTLSKEKPSSIYIGTLSRG